MASWQAHCKDGRYVREHNGQQDWRNEQNGTDYGGHGRRGGDRLRHGGNRGGYRVGDHAGRDGGDEHGYGGGNEHGYGGGGNDYGRYRSGHMRSRGGHSRGRGGYNSGRGRENIGRGSENSGRGRENSGRGRENSGRGRENSGHDNGQARAQFMGDDELQTFSQNVPDEVLAFASQNEYIFLNTFKRRHYCKHPLKLKQMITVLCLLVRSEDKKFAAAMLAQILCAEGNYAGFMLAIDLLLKQMPLQCKDFIKVENVTCIDRLVQIGLVAIGAIPDTVLYTFPVLVLQKTIDDLRRLGQNLAVVASRFEDLHAAFEEKWKKAIEMRIKIDPRAEVGEPPEPFTELPILPTLEELSMKSSQVYLRSNVIDGGYKSWEHYFDVQFRLLREDFVRPLREGIERYCVRGSSHGISDIRVYENARILNPTCLFTGVGFQVRFDVSKLHNVQWEHSKRLIFGSLLCLSDDEFREHIIYATVVKRDPKLLNEGLLTIKFEDGANGFDINPVISFKMVESTAYFEAYRYILETLQNISRNPDVMPMKSYIVNCDNYKDTLRVPGFLDLRTSPAEFDMKDILGTRKQFNVTDLTKWPTAAQTDLDDSQLEALKMALTQELAVIQGPPGTGKTFIGLKIAETYLKNRNIWDPHHASPLFVVCYTNHALDQFLEGIQSIKGVESNIIRIGGRSKSETLSHCLLREKVQNCRANQSVPNGLYGRYQKARFEMLDCKKHIDFQMVNCDAKSNKVIMMSTLEGCISELHIEQLEFYQVTEVGKEIEVWLGLWFPEVDEYDQQAASIQQKQHEIDNFDIVNEMELCEEELIEVDSEARTLQDERMIEGEDIELLGAYHSQRKPNKKKTENMPKMSHGGWSTVQLPDKKKLKLMNKGFNYNSMTKQEADQVDNVWNLSDKKRWMLYLYWVNSYMMQCKSEIERTALIYNQACAYFNECQKEIDCYVAQGSDVIGMTTTGAAKYHHLLNTLRPKIVIFEEAAEVLEAHLVTSIASSVQQVILIGDHKQLRPKPTCYELEKNYNLGVSLFERLVDPTVGTASSSRDGFPYVTLEVQHRMRPEISKLIHPSIYKKIVDAPNVKKYGHVKGVSKDLYFISHTSHEEHNAQNDLKSHINKFEADYVVQLCHYLLKQDYSPSDITILTMYRGQLLELKRRMKRQDFEGVRVTAVDDFQGEENTIIILSLVRSNPESKIGFLNIENRVCVSLSRAKEGLYIVGNGSMLKDKNCTKWPEILRYLERENCIGSGLPLYCQNHPKDSDIMVKPEDFKKRPEGGCQKICGKRLSCGHACPRVCHIKDAEHIFSRCTKICNQQFDCGHFCKRKCFECKKNLSCLPCSEYVVKELPFCHHQVKVSCSVRVDQISCPIACYELLDCGHKCQNMCSAPCTTRCNELVIKRLPCDHQEKVACFQDEESVLCSAKCDAMLMCGDPCEGTCGKCMQGRLHVKCAKKCGRNLMCDHICDFPCASICPPCNKPCNNHCIHSMCSKKCYETCEPCMEQCEWKCAHLVCTKPCGYLCDRPPCNKPCKKLLPCKHQCIGLCGEKCPQKCRICHKDELCEIFLGNEDELDALFIELQDCGHIFEVTDFDKWMASDTLNDSEVMFKTCPKCKTSIRKSVRYGNHIKQVLHDVNTIKLKQIENPTTLYTCLDSAKNEMKGLRNQPFINDDIAHIHKEITSTQPSYFHAAVIKFQLSLLPTILQLKDLIDDLDHQVNIAGFNQALSEKLLVKLKQFLMQEFLSAQQRSDIIFEMRRLSCLIKLLNLICGIRIKSCQIHLNSPSDLHAIYDIIKNLQVYSKDQKVSEEKGKKIVDFIKKLSMKYGVTGLSDEEKEKIVDAIGLPKGHWYKCQNGHFYCIGECGGAMEESKCPECKVSIGGTNHRLAEGNVHAGEIDGSRHAVWSEAANLENFDLADLAHLRL